MKNPTVKKSEAKGFTPQLLTPEDLNRIDDLPDDHIRFKANESLSWDRSYDENDETILYCRYLLSLGAVKSP